MAEIEIEEGGPFVIARISGELTASDSEGFVEDLHPLVCGEGTKLALDLSGLMLIDSSGLSSLMNLVTRARLGQGAVVLVAPSAFVSGVFSVTRLDNWFDVCPNMEAAAKKLTE